MSEYGTIHLMSQPGALATAGVAYCVWRNYQIAIIIVEIMLGLSVSRNVMLEKRVWYNSGVLGACFS